MDQKAKNPGAGAFASNTGQLTSDTAIVSYPLENCKPSEQDLLKAMDQEPSLTDYGLETPGTRRLSTKEERIELFKRDRERLKSRLEEFQACCYWLTLCQQRRTINPRWTSYGLKHEAERYLDTYISNGVFIASVIHLGILYKAFPGNPNVQVALSNKLPVRENYAA
jgi:hypothetical protein